MCLVAFAYQVDPQFPLIVAGNRDEFHARPTRASHWWSDHPGILGGRDLQAGGTWLAVHRNGRFATVTNFRGAQEESGMLRSRGHLVAEFLESDLAPLAYLDSIDGDAYAGFNLLVADTTVLAYLSNRGGDLRELSPGIYGLGNAALDASCHKVRRSKAALSDLIDGDAVNETHLMRLLDERGKAPATEVKSGRLTFAKAHALTATFIVQPDYGTRCSTALTVGRSGDVRFLERRFDAGGEATGESRFAFSIGD